MPGIPGVKIEKLQERLGVSPRQFAFTSWKATDLDELAGRIAEIGEISMPEAWAIVKANSGLTPSRFAIRAIEKLPNVIMEEVVAALWESLDTSRLIKIISEETGYTAIDVEAALKEAGLEFIPLRQQLFSDAFAEEQLVDLEDRGIPTYDRWIDGKIRILYAHPGSKVPRILLVAAYRWIEILRKQLGNEPPPPHRTHIHEALKSFLKDTWPIMERYIAGRFPGGLYDPRSPRKEGTLKYLVTLGIGGNEMQWHYLAALNNRAHPEGPSWIITNSPAEIPDLPREANAGNTLRLSFTRGGSTEETKCGEEVLHGRLPASIIFANKGDLVELGRKHGALVLPMPHRLAGRYSGLKSPINMAPMTVLSMDTETYWRSAEDADRLLDPSSTANPSWDLAAFLFRRFMLERRPILYLSSNHPRLLEMLDALAQLLMEGAAKRGRNLFVVVGKKYPRNSHFEIEGTISNARSVTFLSLVDVSVDRDPALRYAFALDDAKKRLFTDEVLAALVTANLRTYARHAPSIILLSEGAELVNLAKLHKLFEETVYYLCRMLVVDPFSNPQVKEVRDNSKKNVQLLSELMTSASPDISDVELWLKLLYPIYRGSEITRSTVPTKREE